MLEPGRAAAGDGVDVVEAPDTQDLETRRLDVVQEEINVGIAKAANTAIVAVCTSEILGHSVNPEASTTCGDVRTRRRSSAAGG